MALKSPFSKVSSFFLHLGTDSLLHFTTRWRLVSFVHGSFLCTFFHNQWRSGHFGSPNRAPSGVPPCVAKFLHVAAFSVANPHLRGIVQSCRSLCGQTALRRIASPAETVSSIGSASSSSSSSWERRKKRRHLGHRVWPPAPRSALPHKESGHQEGAGPTQRAHPPSLSAAAAPPSPPSSAAPPPPPSPAAPAPPRSGRGGRRGRQRRCRRPRTRATAFPASDPRSTGTPRAPPPLTARAPPRRPAVFSLSSQSSVPVGLRAYGGRGGRVVVVLTRHQHKGVCPAKCTYAPSSGGDVPVDMTPTALYMCAGHPKLHEPRARLPRQQGAVTSGRRAMVKRRTARRLTIDKASHGWRDQRQGRRGQASFRIPAAPREASHPAVRTTFSAETQQLELSHEEYAIR